MYKVGDLVFYENTGVCRVTNIAVSSFSGVDTNQLYYFLKPLYQESAIYTPVGNTKVFMRPVISADEAEQLIDTIPSIQPEAYHNRLQSQLAGHYEASLKTHDPGELIKLTMSIYAKKQSAEQQNRKIGAIDDKFMKCAEELLFGEMSVALDIPKDKVQEYIAARVSGKRKRKSNGLSQISDKL